MIVMSWTNQFMKKVEFSGTEQTRSIEIWNIDFA